MDNNFLSLIKTRRSVRAYKSEFVPSEALDAVLEAGTYAPTGGGHQSPTIIAITDPKYRKEIAKLNAEVMGSNTDPYHEFSSSYPCDCSWWRAGCEKSLERQWERFFPSD